MKPKFSAFFGDQAVKDKYVARMKAHMTADELVQGTGFEDGKGCAVGCTLDKYSHIGYEEELGIPFTIAILEDDIFEALSEEASQSFPLEFLEAVPVGADLSTVFNKMELWLLTDEKHGLIVKMRTDSERQIVNDLAALHLSVINGGEPSEEDWKSVADRADRAYRADLADRAYRAYRAYRADRADRAYRAYLADRADRAYLADLADLADEARVKFISLVKEPV